MPRNFPISGARLAIGPPAWPPAIAVQRFLLLLPRSFVDDQSDFPVALAHVAGCLPTTMNLVPPSFTPSKLPSSTR